MCWGVGWGSRSIPDARRGRGRAIIEQHECKVRVEKEVGQHAVACKLTKIARIHHAAEQFEGVLQRRGGGETEQRLGAGLQLPHAVA